MSEQAARTVQTTFVDREAKAREVLSMAAKQHDYEYVVLLVSGGTDSVAAADAAVRYGPDVGIEPDAVLHANTGSGVAPTQRTVQEFAARHDLPYMEGLNKRDGEMLGHRVLRDGFPSEANHPIEYRQRKERVFDKAYYGLPGELLFISGVRVLESEKRAATIPDNAIDDKPTGSRTPRLTFCSPSHGWTDEEKAAHLDEHDLPVSIANDVLGYSAECVGCAYDEPEDLHLIRIVDPELAWALQTLIQWVWMRVRRGDIDIPIERCIWGWQRFVDEADLDRDPNQAEIDDEFYEHLGCARCSKNTELATDGGFDAE